ncbi:MULTISPECIES: flagellar export chaperone FlgN [unclassified Arsukibacterium]|uniref:flagellar export chaperone FlgN n=1 Tax=unclassified Arsukibacterium TaxID=2635278 RepID=UPI000C8FAF87|nr:MULTISPECIES: flagellar export chaperone FlgN [unclassified Arsukibacterium]MAA96418.1 flagellar biosynthesis protein FlgN [Rheinheimera sp.]HAW93161.1 flagellar biosynthesis protein FlgN [Candidatus Azambacteria bacterium]|tara:strand:+ start:14233 stop:14667 length:435 start_codon:yes stop_codon:yes gene_type:complete
MNSQFEPLNTLLQQQQAQLDALLLLLRQELAALASRDIEALNTLTLEKQQTLTEIQSTDASIAANEWLQAAREESWFKQQISQLEDSLASCKQQNDVNQITLEQSQLTLQRLKTELLSARGKSGLTYTNKGKPTVDNIGRGIKA